MPNRVRSFWSEFKAFAFKGNMIDLAVAVVIGAAFSKVINAVVNDIVMPIVNVVQPKFPYQTWHVWRFPIGDLIGELLNFFIIALVVFLTVVKLTQTVLHAAHHESTAGEPVTKQCPYCLSVIPAKARKCSQCTSDQPDMQQPAVAS
jgi:large conductance mechanosensitive channel